MIAYTSPSEGWITPREYTERRGLKPHRARQELIGRRPWHIRGCPVVAESWISRRQRFSSPPRDVYAGSIDNPRIKKPLPGATPDKGQN